MNTKNPFQKKLKLKKIETYKHTNIQISLVLSKL